MRALGVAVLGLGLGIAAGFAAEEPPLETMPPEQPQPVLPAFPASTNTPAAAETSAATEATNAAPAQSRTNAPTPVANKPPAAKASAVDSMFRLHAGFKIERIAAEPAVSSPAAMDFDEDGRLFVAEASDNPLQGTASGRTGQIRMLEDPEGEGVFSASSVFATNVPLPSAILCYGGGVFVASGSTIVYLQDTNHDGMADAARVVFTGFGSPSAPNFNTQPHSFYWGMDDRIHGASGGAAATVRSTAGNNSEVSLAGHDFSFDPRTLELRPEAGLAGSGMTRDDWGRRFLCSPSRPLQFERIEERYPAQNPWFVPAPLIDDIDGPAIAVFRYAPATDHKQPAGRQGTNDLKPGWLTAARGALIYRGSLFPSNFYGNIFIADSDAHLIHREIIRDQGFTVRAERAPEERNTEFLISTDPAFRPSQIINGPEGALYVADLSGKIFRIAPVAYKPAKAMRLSTAPTIELVTLLAHTNSYQRDTAARLLFEKRDPASVSLLASMATRSRVPLARAMALQGLAGLGVLTDVLTAQAMGDADWRVRRQAASYLEAFARDGNVSDLLWVRLRALATEPVFQVRLQAALTSSMIRRGDKPALLRDALVRDPANLWTQTAVLGAANPGAAALLPLLAEDARIPDSVRGPLLDRMARMIGTSGDMGEATRLIDYIVSGSITDPLVLDLTAALGEGLHRTRSSLRLVDSGGRLARVYTLAYNIARNANLAQNYRVQAIRVLGTGPFTMNTGGLLLLSIIGSPEPELVQSAALRSLGFYVSPEVTPGLLRRWGSIAPALRSQAISTMLARTDQVPAVFTLIESGAIPRGDVLPWQANLFRYWPEPAIQQRAIQLFGPLDVDRTAAANRVRNAVNLLGVPGRGQDIFESRCSACHEIHGAMRTPGPDLAGAKMLGKEGIFEAILSPSKRVRPDYRTVVVSTQYGETVVGTLGAETPYAVVVRQPDRPPLVIPRLNVANIEPQPWSLMPNGLDEGLSPQNVADVIQFLLSVP